MAAPPPPALQPEIGPDGLARENPVIAYTEKVILEEQLQLKKYIQENYSKIRDVEKELENLTLEMKLTAGPKKAALEHLRKKIEISTERIRLAKVKEEQAKKAWETAAQIVKEEEDAKQNLCDDLNRLVQESAASQFSRLEELKKRLESLNPSRASVDVSGMSTAQHATTSSVPQQPAAQNPQNAPSPANNANPDSSGLAQQQRPADAERKRRPSQTGRGRGGVMILPKGRGSSGSGWTGAGFDVDGGT
uniref:RAB6-interacting golgin n=1 Tax=Oryza punctata TaxID=4537 RepID=A0A0E0M658_ORYPU